MKWFSWKTQPKNDDPVSTELQEATEVDDFLTDGYSHESHPSNSVTTDGPDSFGKTIGSSLLSSALIPLTSSSNSTHSRPGSSSSSSSGSDTLLISKNETLTKTNRFQMAKRRVDILTEKARESLQQILDRGDMVDDLNERAHNLLVESFQFKKVTRTLKKKMWMKNIKMMIAVLVASAVLLTLLLLFLIPRLSKRM